MALRTILSLPNPVLRKTAHKVKTFDKDLDDLITDMIETMRNEPGVGLAAPQIGVSSRVIVVEYGDDEDEGVAKKLFAVVNPEIVNPSEEMEKGVEACLSVPGYYGEVERHTAITIKGQNKLGRNIKIKADGWLARIFQHEIDHLDGIVYIDRATSVWQPKEDDEIEVVE